MGWACLRIDIEEIDVRPTGGKQSEQDLERGGWHGGRPSQDSTGKIGPDPSRLEGSYSGC